jgi:phenylacetate-CoA ligase
MDKDNLFKFKNLLDFVFDNKCSSFYRDKYQKVGFIPKVNFQSLADIKKIPLLSKEELMNEDPYRLLFVPEKEAEIISPTSGTTTGKPFVTFQSLKDRQGFTEKVNPKLRVKRLLTLLSPFRAPTTCLPMKDAPISHILVGDIFNLPVSVYLASRLQVDRIDTTPTFAIILKKHLANYPDFEKNIRTIALAGELVSPEKKKTLRKLYPDKEIFITYGLSEAGGSITSQCHPLAERDDEIFFHLMMDVCYFEIIDPKTEKEVPLGKKGELVITRFNSWATPLLRYRTGDLASFEKNDCSCGAPGPLLKVYGRIKYDIVKVGGFELRSDALEKALINLNSYLEDSFEAHIRETFIGAKPKICLTLNLSLLKGVKDSLLIRKKIEEELLKNWWISPRFNLEKAVGVGLFEISQINFIKFPVSTKTRRLLILE